MMKEVQTRKKLSHLFFKPMIVCVFVDKAMQSGNGIGKSFGGDGNGIVAIRIVVLAHRPPFGIFENDACKRTFRKRFGRDISDAARNSNAL